MKAPPSRRREAIRFTRGGSFYQVVEDYRGGDRWLGLRDGRVVVEADNRWLVTKRLLEAG